VRVTEQGEPIDSIEWLREFDERYTAAWNAHDPAAVVACVAEDVVWQDPALPRPLQGRGEVAGFVESGARAFPDYEFAEAGPLAISEDGRVAYAPWRMTGTNTGPLDPPGFAPTGKSFAIEGIDAWRFRDGLIWRYRAVYDFTAFARQLGLMPPAGGRAERAMALAQRLRWRLPF
jgi:steroid delta-isomerase-like uncharacterized protein